MFCALSLSLKSPYARIPEVHVNILQANLTDGLFRLLGFRYRLNDDIFQGGRGIDQLEDGSKKGLAVVYDGILPVDLLQGLREVFSRLVALKSIRRVCRFVET